MQPAVSIATLGLQYVLATAWDSQKNFDNRHFICFSQTNEIIIIKVFL